MVVGSNPVAVTSPSEFAPASSKEFLDIQATIECGFTLKRVRDMIKTYSQNLVAFVFYLNNRVLDKLSEYNTFTYQKTLLHTLFCLFLKLSKAFSVSLSCSF